jgi:hypothetical protein
MPCSTVSSLASTYVSQYFTVRITCPPTWKSPSPSRYSLYKLNRIDVKQQTSVTPLALLTFEVSPWSNLTDMAFYADHNIFVEIPPKAWLQAFYQQQIILSLPITHSKITDEDGHRKCIPVWINPFLWHCYFIRPINAFKVRYLWFCTLCLVSVANKYFLLARH